jgi:hypothetical protein
VCILCFQEADRNMFFWLQEPDESTDVALFERCNATLGKVPVPQRASQPSALQAPPQTPMILNQPDQAAAVAPPDFSWYVRPNCAPLESHRYQPRSSEAYLSPQMKPWDGNLKYHLSFVWSKCIAKRISSIKLRQRP